MNFFKSVYNSISDLVVQKLPFRGESKSEPRFGFLIHPRNFDDVFRKHPTFRFFPKFIIRIFLRLYWPVTVSKVTGLKSLKGNTEIEGFIFSIPLIAEEMIERPTLAQKKIVQALRLARNKGVYLVGLGGLTSSVTGGGTKVLSKSATLITTGHAYTAYNVTSNLFALAKRYRMDPEKVLISIVGAAGSVGSTSALLLARNGYKNFLLIDLPRKHNRFSSLIQEIKKYNNNAVVNISHRVQDVITSDFIITATNAPEALIRFEDLKSGAIVIDDAQPSDVSKEALRREDVLVIEAGIVYTPNILSNFNLGLKNREDNFCCMAEVLVLAANNWWDEHYVINRPSLELVDSIITMSNGLGFQIAEFQNFNEKINNDKLNKLEQLIKLNGVQF